MGDVEMIDWDDWNECDTNSGISKKIQCLSSDDMADEVEEDAVINVSYRIYYDDNCVDYILCERKNIDLIIGDDDRFTIAFMDACKSMCCGEKSLFKIKDASLLNTDDLWMEPSEPKQNNNKCKAPVDKLTYYQIEVHSVKKPKEKFNSENEERIEEAKKYKAAGNALFKQQRLKGAISKYDRCLDWIDVDFSDELLAKEKDALVIATNNNLAMIQIKLKDFATAIEKASVVLDIEPANVKALMRRGQARFENGDLDLAKKDLKKAQSLDKSNSFVVKLLKVTNARHKKHLKKQQALYANMFKSKKKKTKKVKTEEKPKADDVAKDDAKMDVDSDKAEKV